MYNVSELLEKLRLETDKEAVQNMAIELNDSVACLEDLKEVYNFFGFDRKNLDRDYEIYKKLNDIYNFSNGYLLTEYQYNLIRYLYYSAYFGLIIPVKLAIEKVYDVHESEVVARIPNWREELVTYGCDHIFKYIEEYINHINQLEAIYGITQPERMENMNNIMNLYKDNEYVDSYAEIEKAVDITLAMSDKVASIKEIQEKIFKVCGYTKVADAYDVTDMFENCDFSDEAINKAIDALKELKAMSEEYNKTNSLI